MAGNIREHLDVKQGFQRSILNKSNKQNLELLIQRKETNGNLERHKNLHKLTKWDRFRERREVVIDNYLRQKRRQLACSALLKQLFTKQILL